MAEKLDSKELVSFEELLRANSIQVDALSQLLIEKGLITKQEFYTKLKEVQAEWESKRGVRKLTDKNFSLGLSYYRSSEDKRNANRLF